MHIKCPNCSWSPSANTHWNCEYCGSVCELFDTVGECTNCGFIHTQIYCIEWEGGCGELSPLLDWFPDLDAGLTELNIERSID